ncbi:hypothetical protein ADIMK_2698 [Marinobacterium lacunae]|uniref:Uncharacterized protein n=1 Tax=Marinobacterium lacunae TaxID=1232683 RepID=A0A081FXB9_9GAMM|nr:hypothetical protein ADIMK_2698 [Marinobacterium lacunae]
MLDRRRALAAILPLDQFGSVSLHSIDNQFETCIVHQLNASV